MTTLPAVDTSHIGGDVAVDFFNTVDWRLDAERRSERLTSYLHVLAWTRAVDVLSEDVVARVAQFAASAPQDAARHYRQLIRLREETYNALCAGTTPTFLQRSVPRILAGAALTPADHGGFGWRVNAEDLGRPFAAITLELVRFVTSPQAGLFGRCDDESCGWVFVDHSRQHNRRWCSAADCGNRNRVRAHGARKRAAAP